MVIQISSEYACRKRDRSFIARFFREVRQVRRSIGTRIQPKIEISIVKVRMIDS
jgi:hypothetical protein